MTNLKRIKNILLIAAVALMILQAVPYIVSAAYTFPLQDDYRNTGVVLEEMRTGSDSAFAAALRLSAQGYFDYRGYYFSLFFTYFTDGLTVCDISQIRIWQTLMLVFHYSALA